MNPSIITEIEWFNIDTVVPCQEDSVWVSGLYMPMQIKKSATLCEFWEKRGRWIWYCEKTDACYPAKQFPWWCELPSFKEQPKDE